MVDRVEQTETKTKLFSISKDRAKLNIVAELTKGLDFIF